MTRSFFIEIHDASPAVATAIDSLLARLPERVAAFASILVVPNWGGRWPLAAHPAFVERLRAHPGTKVLHGTEHTLGARLWDRVYFGTENESEFATLDERAAHDRLLAGCGAFAAAFGAAPEWFCAPRWRMSQGTRRALAASGIAGILTRQHVEWCGRVVAQAPAVWFDDGTRRAVRALAGLIRRRRIRRLLAAGGPLRVTLHPRDAEDSRAGAAADALLDRLASAGWTPFPLAALAL